VIETRFIDVGRARIAVHTTGKGPLAVLIHGYPLDSSMWLDVMHGELAQRRTLAAIDLRGHGRSPWAGDAVHTMELLASDVAAVIKVIGEGAVDVVGLSMGGYVAMALHAGWPELVRSLVLTNTRAVADSAEAKAGRDAAIATVVAKGRGAIADAMLPKLLAPGASALLQARVRTMIEGTPVETIVADLEGMKVRADRVAWLATVRVPTVVVVGEFDAITPRAEAEAMAKAVRGARLVVVPGAGHMSPMEKATEWLSGCGAHWR